MMRVAVLSFTLLVTAATAAPGGADLEAAALKTAQTLGGVLRDCPANFGQVGTPQKQCVGVGEGVEAARLKLNTALPKEFYGVWRSRDEQRSVYNWVRTAGGYVYLRLQPDPDGRAQTLIYLDLPPAQAGAGPDGAASAGTPAVKASQADSMTLTPIRPTSAAPAQPTPAQTSPIQTAPVQTNVEVVTAPSGQANPQDSTAAAPTPAAPGPNLAPVPFVRNLAVQNRRFNGPDVLAVQNRLIALMRPQRAGQGDGWYGPVTANTVRVFQKAHGLPATGVVNRATWDRLFSGTTQGFDAPGTP
ncbi:peptidoglycan-binding domain-containing protein [Deinococcus arenicola]|uniref:Peptidoglycan-binding protein n=1 Tax=Deinococcus arenicola TaxID=2994950 RepID=A0ABU4DKQ8_9DEIO|nr:peptidoglycan-binding protein [Deinococcus sp. ZS9-10]MDV6373001.1 peptidoglycan-binding protein [Deinococcus sp. ZS9-10]